MHSEMELLYSTELVVTFNEYFETYMFDSIWLSYGEFDLSSDLKC